MKKALYIGLLVIEALVLLLPFYFVLYFEGFLVGGLVFLAIAAIYAFFAILIAKKKKAGDEAGLKKARIFTALVCPALIVIFIIYFFVLCEALGVI